MQVVPGRRLHDDKVAELHILTGSIDIEALAGILKANFEDIVELRLRNSVQPVVVFEFATALAIGAVQFS